MTMVTIIGRGHSGTRAISRTLAESGVFMGAPLNKSSDLVPPGDMYDACRVLARHVRWLGDLQWDWAPLHEMEIPLAFKHLLFTYLESVLTNPSEHRGWKIPETTLAFPWIARLFPEIKYIYWVRNPRDSILGTHKTDDLWDFGVQYPPTEDVRERRAISWLYQYELVKATPKPANWLQVTFEEFVLNQEETLARIEDFLGLDLVTVPVKPEAVGRWETDEDVSYYDFLGGPMQECGYPIPATSKKG
jgi:hypothetical protein